MIDTTLSWLLRAQTDLLWGAVIVGSSFLLSIAFVVVVVTRLPQDYFLASRATAQAPTSRGARIALWLARNVAGMLLIAAGVVMSIPGVPGQGILTILIGVMLMDLPGKRALQRMIVRRRPVLRSVNRIRARFGKPELRVD